MGETRHLFPLLHSLLLFIGLHAKLGLGSSARLYSLFSCAFLGSPYRRQAAASSVRFYCTDRSNHDSYANDPWTKYDQDHPLPPIVSALTHVDQAGNARMVDVSDKPWSLRKAAARAEVWIGPEAARLVAADQLKKGDVLKVSELAGISGGKLTSQLIPLCHPVGLHQLSVRLKLHEDACTVVIDTEAITRGPTGVEMEALTAATVAGLTVIDMVKSVTREAEIRFVHLVSKSGGTRGDYQRSNS